jgi:hypothetical protein
MIIKQQKTCADQSIHSTLKVSSIINQLQYRFEFSITGYEPEKNQFPIIKLHLYKLKASFKRYSEHQQQLFLIDLTLNAIY